jgi:leader peptidase (prepilin peptidase)/N-methyltransferase
MMEGTAWSLVIGGLFGAFSGWLVPALIRLVPEPKPDNDETGEKVGAAPGPVKPLYVDIARTPALGAISSSVAALCGVLIGWRLDIGWALVAWLVFLPVALALGTIDARTKLLPSHLLKPTYLVIVPLVYLPLLIGQDWAGVKRTTLAWLIYGGVFFLLWLIYPRGMGYGDVRLSGLIGVLVGVVGWAELIVTFYATFLLGPILMVVIGGLLSRSFSIRGKQLPFGPFMLLGALIGLTSGRWVLTHLLV